VEIVKPTTLEVKSEDAARQRQRVILCLIEARQWARAVVVGGAELLMGLRLDAGGRIDRGSVDLLRAALATADLALVRLLAADEAQGR